MLFDSMAPLPWAQDDSMAANSDLPDNFDFQELFSSSEVTPNLTCPPSMPRQSQPVPTQAQQPVMIGTSQQRPLVNLQMIVDPASGDVTYPRQVLTYDLGFGKVESVVFGPVTLEANGLDSKPSEVIGSNPTMSFSVLSALDGMQQQPQRLSSLCAPLSLRLPPSNMMPETMFNSGDIASLTSSDILNDLTPVRALSAYNWFFRDERDRILNGGDCDWTRDKQARLLASHWHQDRTKKRRHRKTHGKINFTTLSKLVSQRWKELNESQKQFYRQVAAEDFQRYQREMDEYKTRLGGSTCAGACYSQVVG